MLARLQRLSQLAVFVLAAAWAVVAFASGHPWIAAIGAATIAGSFVIVLGLEFVLLAVVHGDDPAPRPTVWQLMRAWAIECVTSGRVFGWWQPWRATRWPDLPDATGTGIVFVHGYVCNRGFWTPWMKRCHREARPFVAVSLEPVFGSIDAAAPLIDAAVERLQRSTGRRPIVVAHSMGGLAVRAWLAHSAPAARRVAHVVTIATPHRGTWLARWGLTTNARQMRPNSDWLGALATREAALHRVGASVPFTCFHGHADNIVFPPRRALLPGATVIHLSATPHVAMAYHPAVVAEVTRLLLSADGGSAGSLAAEPESKALRVAP